MPSTPLQTATDNALATQHVGIFGHYLLNGNDVAKIVEIVLREIAVLAKPECQLCISELIAAAQSNNQT